MRFRTLICALAALVTSTAVASGPLTEGEWAETLVLAGRQRTMSQKMAKEFFLIASNIEADANRANLWMSVDRFDRALGVLLKGDPVYGLPNVDDEGVVRQLGYVVGCWEELRPIYLKVSQGALVTPKMLDTVLAKDLDLLGECDLCFQRYESAGEAFLGDEDSTQGVNLVSRQEMLTQKMAKDFVLISMNANVEASRKSLRQGIEAFGAVSRQINQGERGLGLEAGRQLGGAFARVDRTWSALAPVLAKGCEGAPSRGDLAFVGLQSAQLLDGMGVAVTKFTTLTLAGQTYTQVPDDSE